MEGALDLNNVHELQSELSRLYRALEESDHDVRKYRAENKSLREDKQLYASSAKAADSGDAGQTAKKIIELSKKVRNVTAEMESAKTKVRNTEKENRELKAKNELLAAKMKQNNMDSNSISDSASAFSLQNLSKRYEAELREKSRKEKELKTQIEQLQLEIKSQKKILEQELGENFTSASSLLNGNWKGRQNQIMALQSRIKELERSKNQQNAVPGQLKELTKFHKDTLEKHKAEINSKDDQIKDLSQKLQQVKVRCQTLTNHQRVLKEHSLALEEKTKHDDELIEALSQRIKQIPAAVHSDEIPRGPTVKLESKETISEIKNLKEKIAILEQTVARKEEQIEQLHGACETLRNENESLQNSIVDGKVETKRQPIERDSLDLGAEDTVSNVQIQTLEREKQVAQQHLDECRKELSAFIERFDRTSSDELVADDLRSLRAVLQAQIQGRSSDTRRFQNLLEQNRLAFLEAIQLLQK